MSSVFVDPFTRADAGILGVYWLPGPATSTWSIVSNQANVASTSNIAQANCTVPAFTDDQFVELTLGSSNVGTGGPFCRSDLGGGTHYLLRVASATSLTPTRSIAGARTTLTTITVPTLVAGDVLRMEVSGSGASVELEFFVNGVSVGTYSDTHADRILSGRYSGIRQTSNSLGMKWDNFDFGDLVDPTLALPYIAGWKLADTGGTTASDTLVFDPSDWFARYAIAEDDLVFANVCVNAESGNTISPPAGWTEVQPTWGTYGTFENRLYWRRRQAGDSSYTFTVSGTARHLQGTMFWVRGVKTGTAVKVLGTPKGRADAPLESTTTTAPAIVTDAADELALAILYERSSGTETVVPSIAGSELVIYHPQTGSNLISTIIVAAEQVPVSGTNTGDTVATYPQSNATNGWGYQWAVEPEPDVAGTPGLTIWDGVEEIPAVLTVWDGADEVPATLEVVEA